MSAPWEVWAGRNGYIGWEPKPELRVDGLHRYLRADLTCGECKKCRKNNCDHKVGTSMGAVQTWPYEDSSACMAFTPKEAK